MLRRFEGVKRDWSMHVLPSLHAKVYVANRQLGLIGSSNLTLGGFERNLEMMLLVEAEEASDAVALVDDAVRERAIRIGIDDLQQWTERFEEQVRQTRKRVRRERRRLHEAQRDADAFLGFSHSTVEGAPAHFASNPPIPVIPDRALCDSFTEWLRRHDDLAGARKLVENATDTVVGRNQGHFRRFFGSDWMFLNLEPQWRDPLREWLAEQGADGYYDLPDDMRDAWIGHLARHAAISENDVCSYPLVRRYLPPRYGGTVIGGGGGVSTFKRMFPLVSEFLELTSIQDPV
jgi:PLD-like domain